MIVVMLVVGHTHPTEVLSTPHTLFLLSLLISLSPSKSKDMQEPSLHFSYSSSEANTSKRDRWSILMLDFFLRLSRLDIDDLLWHQIGVVQPGLLVVA